MAAEEVADMRGPGGRRTRIPHGNMRAKLPNYIGQVIECKADGTHYSRKVLAYRRVEHLRREERDSRNVQTPAPVCCAIHANLPRLG